MGNSSQPFRKGGLSNIWKGRAMNCNSCGAQIPADSMFCTECGARQNVSASSGFAPPPTQPCRRRKTSRRSHSSNEPLTRFQAKPSACNRRTTCNKWAKSNPTCFKAWLRGCISSKTFRRGPTRNSRFKVDAVQPIPAQSVSSTTRQRDAQHAGCKPPETTCLISSVGRPSPAVRYRTPVTCPRWPLAGPKSPTTPPILPPTPWSTAWRRLNGP